MPPKKRSATDAHKATEDRRANGVANYSQSRPSRGTKAKSTRKAADIPKSKTSSPRKTSKKRKDPPSDDLEGSHKSARSTPKIQPSQLQLLKFMVSPDAAALCRPDEESRDLVARGKKADDVVTYTSSIMNPFQELLCAVVLSRPISHMLGLRTIRTLFNAPYKFTSAKKVADAGQEMMHRALWDARTQHKAKTADQVFFLGDLMTEMFADEHDPGAEQLGDLLDREDVEKALGELTRIVKGFGPTGRDIFRRRVQWLWEAAYPFVDMRGAKALEALGLPDDADGLRDAIARHWGEIKGDVRAGEDEEQRKRRAFVVVLEMATAADLEKKTDRLLEAADKMEVM